MIKKALVTGANGQLGRDLVPILSSKGWDVTAASREELNLTDRDQIRKAVLDFQPDVVFHCGAYTKVDQAETDVELAFDVNAWGTQFLADACEKVKAKLVYVSTDYVFNGNSPRPYHEFDVCDPINVYGASKRAGEMAALSHCSKTFIVRTSWVYGNKGPNFVLTMLKLAESNHQLKVVQDQIGSPTFTPDLSVFLEELAHTDYYGIYHATNSGYCSWYEFAQEIFRLSGKSTQVIPVTTAEFPRPAKRPANSRLYQTAIRKYKLTPLPSWQASLSRYLHFLN